MKYITQIDLDDMDTNEDAEKRGWENLKRRFIQFKTMIGRNWVITEITGGDTERFTQGEDFKIIELDKDGKFERECEETNALIEVEYEEF